MAGKHTDNNSGNKLFMNPSADGEVDEDFYTKISQFLNERWSPGSVGTLHRFSDLDSAQIAQHHTLGPRHNQSAPGDHSHDGVTSKNIGAYTEYVNTANSRSYWFGSTANPAIGNGTIEARYCKIGTRCDVVWYMVMGSSTTFGSGAWLFTLPFPAKLPVANTNGMCGTAMAYMNGPFHVGAVFFAGNNEVSIVTDAQTSYWGNSTPAAWGASNAFNLSFSISYETVS